MVLENGFQLIIYDRLSDREYEDRIFPEKYQPYIANRVPYVELRETMRDAEYVININSVEDSDTMFARRVVEIMACGRMIISNESVGMRRRFPGRVWFVGEPFDSSCQTRAVQENMRTVYAEYTFGGQLEMALREAGILQIS